MQSTSDTAWADAVIADTQRLLGCDAADVPAGAEVADWLRIHRFVEATGDENPLYLDAAYGARSWWRTMVAPATFVLAIRVPESTGGLHDRVRDPRGVHLLTRVRLWWRDHVTLGQRLTSELRVASVQPGPRWRGRATVSIDSDVSYRAGGVEVATGRGTVTGYPLRRGGEQFVERQIHRYEADEIARLTRALDDVAPRRGAIPRLFETVAAGDELPRLVKGPLSWSDIITWIIAEGRPVNAGNVIHGDLVHQPARTRPHPVTAWPVWDAEHAREELAASADGGYPAPHARSSMLVALAGHVVTDWMGDDGFLRHLDVSVDAPLLYGDALLLSGRVADTFSQQHGAQTFGCARLAIDGRNQIGDRLLRATALVFLPSAGRPIQLPIRP